jgi:S-adenosyl-L-methionine hydrolase (adenosine-forming)
MNPTIALLTDFGTTDIYVGIAKAVILNICPSAQIIDLAHNIQTANVRQAALALLHSFTYFPPQTIFAVMVDPGVGSARRVIMARAGGYRFVAPDNGVLSYALDGLKGVQMVEMTNPQYRLPQMSNTAHGRDIFAPVSAFLASGIALDKFGPPISDPVVLPRPALHISGGSVTGEVLNIDSYGNVLTSIGDLRWGAPGRLTLAPRYNQNAPAMPIPAGSTVVNACGQSVKGIHRLYSDVTRGEMVAVVGALGYLELAINQGHCASRLEISIGDPVTIQIGKE